MTGLDDRDDEATAEAPMVETDAEAETETETAPGTQSPRRLK